METLKFTLVLIIALIIGQGALQAQTNDDITFGVRAGANFSDVYGLKSITKDKGRTGITAGVFARLGGTLYVEPGVNFNAYSARFDFNSRKYDAKFNQLQIPLLVGYKFINNNNFNAHAAIGPEANFNLKKPAAVETFTYKSYTTNGKLEAGVDIQNITIDIAASRSLNKINKGLDQTASLYSLTVGYRFK